MDKWLIQSRAECSFESTAHRLFCVTDYIGGQVDTAHDEPRHYDLSPDDWLSHNDVKVREELHSKRAHVLQYNESQMDVVSEFTAASCSLCTLNLLNHSCACKRPKVFFTNTQESNGIRAVCHSQTCDWPCVFKWPVYRYGQSSSLFLNKIPVYILPV